MSEPQPTSENDATFVQHPEPQPVPTHSSLSPQEKTAAGETKSAVPMGAVVGPGSQLGPYQLLDKLGEGGMGAVYKARHAKLGRLVALKVLPPHVLSRPDALSRFEREMKAVGTLQHPNVVQALDAGDYGGVHYLSMEYVEGQDLQELVKAKGPMSVVNACKAIRQAALGLAAAHKLGLVHRDIKPSNLFVTKQTGQIKILDMGLALLSQEEAQAALTSTGQCFGTPDYMAPEQWEDAHTCDGRADLYALGCTLFLLLVGRTPYGGDDYRSVPKKMMGHVRDPIPDLKAARAAVRGGGGQPPQTSLLPSDPSAGQVASDVIDTLRLAASATSDIPDGLDAIYRKLMAKDPKDRFASADQLAEALTPFTRQGGSQKSSPHAPREESRTTSNLPKHPNSDVAPAPSDGSPAPAIVTRSVTATLGNASVDPLAATSTWTSGNVGAASSTSGTVSARNPYRKWLFVAGGAAAILLLGMAVFTTINKDGTRTDLGASAGNVANINAANNDISERSTSSATKAADFAEQRAIAELILQVSGNRVYVAEPDTEISWSPSWSNADILTPGTMVTSIAELPTTTFVICGLEVGNADDRGVERILMSSELQFLSLWGSPISDQSTSRLAAHPRLKTLALGNCGRLTDRGVAEFGQSKTLEVLLLSGVPITDVVLPDIGAMNQLTYLNLDGTRISDDGLQHLRQLNFLKGLNLGRTPVTAAGIERLQSSLPQCKILANTWHGWPADAPAPAIAPFDAEQAKKHQEEWAAYLKVPVEYTNSIGMKFALIPPGEFLMGSSDVEVEAAVFNAVTNKEWAEHIRSERPVHKVILTQPFYLGRHEVTQSQFARVTGESPSHYASTGKGREIVEGLDTGVHPVEMVAWNDAFEFCNKLSLSEGLEIAIDPSAMPADLRLQAGYRLPTEGEWEFACRAGTDTRFWTGDDPVKLTEAAWFQEPLRTQPVGLLRQNPFGLYDVHGNVWEWVFDLWAADYYGKFAEQPAINPIGPETSSKRGIRGGLFSFNPTACRSAGRHATAPTFKQEALGFRAALSVNAVRDAMRRQPKIGWHGWPADAPKPASAPFNAEQAKKHQEEWAAYLKVPVEYTNSIGMKFRLIPPGEFTMGSTKEEIDATLKDTSPDDKLRQECIKSEAPQHKVILTQPMYLGVNEVTQAEYEKVMGVNPSHFAPMGMGKEAVTGMETAAHPVEMVNWNDAAEFCAKLSKQEKLKPFYFRTGETITPLNGTGYRLPSEAEWEFACRSGTTTTYWIGDKEEDLVRASWFGVNSGERTHAAGELKANPFGLYDIHGNVWEWVQDGWNANWYGQFQEKPAINPNSSFSAGSLRLHRGGCYFQPASSCGSSYRIAFPPHHRNQDIGFRVSLVVGAVKAELAERAGSTSAWHGWPADAPKPAIAPFDADQAKKHQEEWAAYLKVPVEYTNTIGMKFRLIPPGEFMMGSTPEEIAAALMVVGDNNRWQEYVQSEMPRHEVTLTQAIYLGVNEVTQKEYEAVMRATPSHFSMTGAGKDAVGDLDTRNHPVETVSWNDATEFCAKLGQKEELKPHYFRSGETVSLLDGTGYRLPTEAEWEFACRAGTTTKFWIGNTDDQLMKAGWFASNAGGRTHAVGQLKPNPFGLNDTHGNVWELVEDAWDATYYRQFEGTAAVNPIRSYSSGPHRVVRGGYWYGTATHGRSASRNAVDPPYRDANIGFRVSLPVDAVRQALKVTGRALPQSAVGNSAALTDSEKLPANLTNSLGMEFVKVPKGTGWLGGGGGKPGEQKVEFTDDFYLGKYAVTQEEWEKVTGSNPSHFSRNGAGKNAVTDITDADLKRFPVENLSWDDAQLFVEQLNKQEPSAGWVYRLPKEVEWEYACRGGSVTGSQSAFDFYLAATSSELLSGQANFGHGDAGRTCAVGSYQPNSLALHDMHGNVHVWCADRAPSPDNSQNDTHRVLRGGSYWSGSSFCKATTRFVHEPSYKHMNVGLRVARIRVETAKPKTVATTPSTLTLDVIDFAAERQAAEWVLANRGTMTISVSPKWWDWRDYGASDDAKPLPSEPFVIVALDLRVGQVKSDEDLARITRCPYIEILNLSHANIDRQSIDLLGQLPRLKSLVLGGQKELPLSKLGQISTLDSLSISSDMIDDRLEFVGRLPSLRTLTIWGPQPPEITLLSEAPQLRTVVLVTPDAVDDAMLATVQSRHDKLRILVGWDGKFRTVGHDPIHEAAKHLVNLGVKCGGSNYQKPLTKLLTKSDLEDGSIWAFDVQNVPATVQLSADDREKLKLLNSYHFTAEGQREADELAKSLSGNHGIASITMTDCELTDTGLEHLQKLVSLRSINVSKTKVTPAGVERFHLAAPYCGITSDFGVILPTFMSDHAAKSK